MLSELCIWKSAELRNQSTQCDIEWGWKYPCRLKKTLEHVHNDKICCNLADHIYVGLNYKKEQMWLSGVCIIIFFHMYTRVWACAEFLVLLSICVFIIKAVEKNWLASPNPSGLCLLCLKHTCAYMPELCVYVHVGIHIPTYQSCSFCPGREAAWAEGHASSCVLGGTDAERMSPWAPGLIGQSCSTCWLVRRCIYLGRRFKDMLSHQQAWNFIGFWSGFP